MAVIYEQLHRHASAQPGVKVGHTLNPTALVHEAFLKLMRRDSPDWRDRKHFLSVAALAMRQIVIDHARRMRSQRHKHVRSDLDPNLIPSPCSLGSEVEVLAVDEALQRLRAFDRPLADLVDLHWFAGQSFDVCAEMLEVSTRTARRYWATACDWLRRELHR
jgi:RNA polymerase sigma factor (TIGR02999 family)